MLSTVGLMWIKTILFLINRLRFFPFPEFLPFVGCVKRLRFSLNFCILFSRVLLNCKRVSIAMSSIIGLPQTVKTRAKDVSG